MKLLLFCVESNKQEQIDWIYIESVIKHVFIDERTIVRRPLFMNSRSRYNNPKVLREIKRYQTASYDSVHVIYCVDTDKIETNIDQKKQFEEITKFCSENGFELVWFCHDIEEVFLGYSVSDSEKKASATRFVSNEDYKKISIKKLKRSDYHKGNSNLLTVLEKYLSIKNNE